MHKNAIDRIDKEYPEEKITQLYNEGRAKIDPALKEFLSQNADHPETLKARWEDIRQLIFHVDGRINYWEARRTQYLTFAAGIFVATIAAIVTILNVIINSEQPILTFFTYLFVIAPSLILLIASINLISIWNRQNNPSYPFTKGYRNWRWHYRHAEAKPLNTDVYHYTPESFANEVSHYVDNLYSFKKRMLDADLAELLDQDLSQLYLCITNEKFKIKFVSELRDSLVRSLKIALWLLILTLPVSGFFIIFSSLGNQLTTSIRGVVIPTSIAPSPTFTPYP